MATIQGKAAAVFSQDAPLRVVDVNFEPPKAGEVRIKMKATGLCRSDLYSIKGIERGGAKFKGIEGLVIPGHEGAGIVESVGSGVSKVKQGDHVILLWMPMCSECLLCKGKPMTNFCMSGNLETSVVRKDGTSRVKLVEDGTPLLTMTGGAFAEYAVVEETMVCKVPDSIPLDVAALMGCCIATGYGSAMKLAKVEKGSTCAVWGMGAVGQCIVIGCKAGGAAKIFAIDKHKHKLDLALELGATDTLNAKEIGAENVMEALKGQTGLDYAFECTGSPECLEQAQKLLAPWGTLVVVGLYQPGVQVPMLAEKLLMGQTVTGGLYGGYKARDGIDILIREIENGRLDGAGKLVTHRLPLSKINEGVELLVNGKSIRTIIEM